MHKNMITLAILAACAPAYAVDFGVGAANTDKVKFDKWQCKKCATAQAVSGNISMGVGSALVDDIHAANALGADDDGAVAALSGKINLNRQNWQLALKAHDLGQEHGDAQVVVKNGSNKATLDYRQLYQVNSGNTNTHYYQQGDELLKSDAAYSPELSLKRERINLAFENQMVLFGLPLTTSLDFGQEQKTGTKAGYVTTPSPINIAQRVDQDTQSFGASAMVAGKNWLTQLAYQGSDFSNNQTEISHQAFGSLYAEAPDNQSHQVTLSGNYLADLGQFDGRISAGRMIQDDGVVNALQSPITSWDGEVDTLDATGRFTTVVGNGWRLSAKLNHNSRDNNSSVFQFNQFDYNAVSGITEENVLLDSTQNRANLSAQYRIAKGYRLDAGFDYDSIERTQSDGLGARETTDEYGLWTALKISAFEGWKLNLKAGFSQRDGSEYQANKHSSSEENELMRKYYLADRDRTEFEVRATHTPLDNLSVDMSAQYAKDDYSATEIGLTDSEDYGYQLTLNYLASQNLTLYGFAGQQWIDTNQAGALYSTTPTWTAEINDEFISLGAGFEYRGLMADKLVIGGDYLYADSSSDADNSAVENGQFDDYYSYSHSFNLYGAYQLSERSQLKLDYRYERYYDTDYANVATDAIGGLTTLGELDHNYNAHLVMLTYSLSL
ncbi:MtrB/PioB family decaheme-associated outer membrane protein [Ferrimonas aestuarii]|uniref:MtrB/PioB family decaheme-associated outer membrane protein n=1 Tax=Ferrimonas aestuarii TaxID=2569539 RepID=A0A4U1BTX8_9GAMM|nr:MtrB/PioB family decaheme-associated outer membrane protein [Ferrimonas aestuarii]TKB57408.1 MtrB/PioB family decaheme-associated outer membrane protein [Ferrimonas aestuarii]